MLHASASLPISRKETAAAILSLAFIFMGSSTAHADIKDEPPVDEVTTAAKQDPSAANYQVMTQHIMDQLGAESGLQKFPEPEPSNISALNALSAFSVIKEIKVAGGTNPHDAALDDILSKAVEKAEKNVSDNIQNQVEKTADATIQDQMLQDLETAPPTVPPPSNTSSSVKPSRGTHDAATIPVQSVGQTQTSDGETDKTQ